MRAGPFFFQGAVGQRNPLEGVHSSSLAAGYVPQTLNVALKCVAAN